MSLAHLCIERLVEAGDGLLQLSLKLLADLSLLLDGLLDLRLVALDVSKEVSLPLEDTGNRSITALAICR